MKFTNHEVSTMQAHDLLEHVRSVFVRMTRYPDEVVVADADLEQDLGIDSVKRGEILATLRTDFGLPDALKATPDELRTVASVSAFLSRTIAARGGAAGHANGHTAPAAYANGHTAPAAYANGHAAPAGHANGHPAPAGHAHAITPARAPAAIAAQRPTPAPVAGLAGKTVLVTGSSRGLGRAIATKLGRAGARVVVNSFHSRDDGEAVADEIRGAGGDAVHVWGSVANPAHIDRLFEDIARDVGELHHLVNNASNGRFGPLEQTTPEHWELAFRTNVIGYHLCALRAARLMERHGGGRIVALSSNGSSRYLEHFGAMGAVKAAVESLTRALAVELAPRNVQVNCVSAGPIYGHVTSNYPDHERILPYWESRTPGGRLCTEEDVADAVLLLLSDGARMVNGATLTVDGGGSLCI
ncbi:SDR family oxidoreductase [Sorangium sp. So ce513]|uniref:SDR family oxidoreductase n=1 Tax=Sorangium sp. So ce513 TaxID=3133315 RepID=UPI003F5FF6ED